MEKVKAYLSALWEKIKKFCHDSLTMAWAYILTALGSVGLLIDQLGAAFGDPQLKQQMTDLFDKFGVTAKALAIVGVVTLLARLRSLIKK